MQITQTTVCTRQKYSVFVIFIITPFSVYTCANRILWNRIKEFSKIDIRFLNNIYYSKIRFTVFNTQSKRNGNRLNYLYTRRTDLASRSFLCARQENVIGSQKQQYFVGITQILGEGGNPKYRERRTLA